ncbi:MAG: FAD-binding oxidoreductase [Desulfobacteraceae bacterium]|nr:MAG: FAD-binding oxidoreductase [Desulfobacteraceae bacterium]
MRKRSVSPDWFRQEPPRHSYRAVFKWGAAGRFHHPKSGLIRLLQAQLGWTAETWRPRQTGVAEVRAARPSRLAPEQIERLTAMVTPENAGQDDFARVRYAHGQSAEEILQLRGELPAPACDLVLHPRNKQDVQDIVQYCHAESIPVTVFSGGTSVTLGVRPAHGGVTLVMSTHMRRVLAFNETNQTITVEPGMFGPEYEKYLNQAPEYFQAGRRYTGGHFPQSFEYSTVGGWIATLGAGQQSSYYGDAYDLVISQEYVTPTGSFVTAEFPAAATGPKVNDIMKGSEGAFGVLTAATLKIFRWMPANTQRFAYMLPDWPSAIATAREISQGEFGMPSVLRISDPEETEAAVQMYGLGSPVAQALLRLRGLHELKRCLLIGQSDGQAGFSRHVARRSKSICRKMGGLWLSGYPVARWAHGRFLDPYARDDLFDMGILIDTLETTVTWDRLEKVHSGVRKFIKARPRTLCLAHASHFYLQGTNLYFIFIMPMTGVEEYRRFQNGIIEQILSHGGSLSHHHGTGKLMGPWMEAHLGAEQMAVLRALKRHFDPRNIMNPGGTLGLDGGGVLGRTK